MAAPEVQFNSEQHLAYFEPTVDQYVKKLEQAVASNDLSSAQQALANINKAISAPSSGSNGTASQHSQQISADLESIGAALQSGDLASAANVLGDFHEAISTARGNGKDSSIGVGESQATNPETVEFQPGDSQDGTSGTINLRV